MSEVDYQVSIEETGEVSREVTFKVPSEVYKEKYTKSISSLQKNANLKGFRAGKVPYNILEKKYGDAVKAEVLENFLKDVSQKIFREESLKIVSIDKVDIADKDNNLEFEFKVSFSLFPEPTISNYEGLELEVNLRETKEEEFETHKNELLERSATYEDISDRDEVLEGDTVEIDYEVLINGELIQGRDSKGVRYSVASDKSENDFEKSLNASLIGAKIGEVVKIEIPKNNDETVDDEQKKPEVIEHLITIKKILHKIIPEVNDELAKKWGFETANEVLEKLRSGYEIGVKRDNKAEKFGMLMKKLIELNPFEIPQVLIDNELRRLLFESGILDGKKKEDRTKDVSKYRASYGAFAESSLRSWIIIDRLINQLGLKVEDEEFDSLLELVVEEEGWDVDSIKDKYGFSKDKKLLYERALREKMLQELIKWSKFVPKKLLEDTTVENSQVQEKGED